MRKLVILSICLLFLSDSLFSQETSTDTLSEVIVLSDKIQIPFKKQNRNIQIINKQHIASLPALSINEILQYSAGIDIRQKGPGGTQADIGIDGGTFDQTLVLLNGIKMSDPQTGHNMMNLPVPIESIERIEILKGPAARIYGVNALMGVINIVTKTSGNDLIVSGLYGTSFKKDDSTGKNFMNYSLNATKLWDSKYGHQLLSVKYDHSTGYRYNTDFKNFKLLYNGSAKLSNISEIKWTTGFVNNGFGANSFYAPPRDKEAYEEVRTIIAGIKAPIKLLDKWTFQPYLNYKYGYDHYLFVRNNPSVFENIHHTNVVDGGFDNIIHTNIGIINIGVNLRSESINSTNLGERSRMNYGAFLEWQQSFGDLDLSIGSFFNHNSVFGFKAYPGLDIGYAISPKWRIYFNTGMGQRLPTFTDLYYSDPNSIGNENLLPEFMINYEAGTKYAITRGHFHFATFYKSGSDFIDWIRVDTNSPSQVHNFTTIQTLGLQIDYKQSVEILPNIDLNWGLGYTYLQPKLGKPKWDNVSAGISQYAINSLQHQLITTMGLNIKNRANVNIYNRFIDRLNTPDNREEFLVGKYSLFDVRVNFKIKNFTLFGDVNNIFNVEYIQSGVVPLPGRWVTAGFRYTI